MATNQNIFNLKKPQGKLTQEYLKTILKYNPLTGSWTWKIKKGWKKPGDIAGTTDSHGYRQIRINGKVFLASRLAWFYQEGYWPEHQIDHINRIRNDDRWCNLRHITAQCNARNSKTRCTNKSGVTGVFWEKTCKKWRVTICNFTSKTIEDLTDAVKLRWELEKKYGFPNCNSTSTAYLYLKERKLI